MDGIRQPHLSEDIALHSSVRENESALLHALLQASDYGVLLSSLDRQDIVANRRLGELFRLTPQEIVETDPDAVRKIVLARVKNPEEFDTLLDRTYANPDLTYEDEVELTTDPPCVLRRFTHPVISREGQIIARLWTFLDITETKRLQAEVQAQLEARTADYQATSDVLQAMNELCRIAVQRLSIEELLKRVVELARPLAGQECAAVLLLSPDGTALEGMGGTKRHAARPLRLSSREDAALAESLARRPAAEEMPLMLYPDYHGIIARKLHCRTVGVAPLYRNGRVLGVLVLGTGAAHPSPDRYRIAHLRALVDQIALALETHFLQTELRAALDTLRATQQKMVEMEKLRTAGMLAASVAHDIRNILTAMQMDVALVPEPASSALCDHINRFSALTHRLLAYARPFALETRPTHISEVISHILPLVSGHAQVCEVAIVANIEDNLRPVAADASQLEHLFVNLCLNAIQAMTEWGGTLTIAARAREQWLEILVQDTGGGIAPDVMTRIFDPFFTTRATGLGLGLFSCKRIVEEHGGQLTVTSAPGEGAAFTTLLPFIASKSGNG